MLQYLEADTSHGAVCVYKPYANDIQLCFSLLLNPGEADACANVWPELVIGLMSVNKPKLHPDSTSMMMIVVVSVDWLAWKIAFSVWGYTCMKG